jgi:hypothetical protein
MAIFDREEFRCLIARGIETWPDDETLAVLPADPCAR